MAPWCSVKSCDAILWRSKVCFNWMFACQPNMASFYSSTLHENGQQNVWTFSAHMHVSGAHNGNTVPCTLSFQFQLFASRIAERVGGEKHTNGGDSKWRPCPTSFLFPSACTSRPNAQSIFWQFYSNIAIEKEQVTFNSQKATEIFQ